MEKWFEASLEEVRAARRWVAEVLNNLGCAPDGVDRAVLVASELTANVVQHTRSDLVGVGVSLADSTARIEVIDLDPGTGSPNVAPLDPTASRGRGLQIVEATALRWGVENRGDRRGVG